MQRPRLAATEHRERVEGGVAGCACVGRTDGGTGNEAVCSLDTCPTPSWDPAVNPDPGCSSGSYRLGMDVGRLGGLGRMRRGLFAWMGRILGTPESSQATGARGVALWEGRSVRMAAGAAGHPAARRVVVSAWSYGQRWNGVLALGTAPRWPGLARREPKWPGHRGACGHLWKAFVLNPHWEAPPLFRN